MIRSAFLPRIAVQVALQKRDRDSPRGIDWTPPRQCLVATGAVITESASVDTVRRLTARYRLATRRGLEDSVAPSPLPVRFDLRYGAGGAYAAGVAAPASSEVGVAASAAASTGAVSAPSGT
jgi:hypothetical protein